MAFYRLIMALLLPVLVLHSLRRGESRADLSERLGGGAVVGPLGLWLHGASLGELASARWLVEALLTARPDLRLVVTANTITGRQLVRGWRLERVTAQLAPLDLGFALRRFLNRQRPRALISLEAEVWPLRFARCKARTIPVILIGARMSERSFQRWHRRPALAAAMMSSVRLASAQDGLSRQRLHLLGLDDAVTLPDLDLKAQVVVHLPVPQPPPRAGRAGWLLAASTHDGDEAVILRAFAAQQRFAHLILAPRHPNRAPAIIALLRGLGLAFAQRSLGASPDQAPVYLADSLGEMDQWYAKCGAVVIGGSFAELGGHTPWEPMRHATALLHGPSTHNFAAQFAALDASGGALAATPDSLAGLLDSLDGPAQDRMADIAKAVLQAQGDISALLERITQVCGI